jgi:hypothetical protein
MLRGTQSCSVASRAVDEVERMDSDGTDRFRVTYEFLTDLMRLDDETRTVSVNVLARVLRKHV